MVRNPSLPLDSGIVGEDTCLHFLWIYISSTLGLALFRETDQHVSSPTRNCRGVSLIHVSIVIPLAIQCLDSPALSADRAFGWDERAGTLFAVSAGYFLWDTIDMLMHFEAIGFVAHGSCHHHHVRPTRALTRGNPQAQHVSSCTSYVS